MPKKKVFLKEQNRDSPLLKYQLETWMKSYKAANSQRGDSQEMSLNSHAIDAGSSIPLNTGSRFQTHLGLSKKKKYLDMYHSYAVLETKVNMKN